MNYHRKIGALRRRFGQHRPRSSIVGSLEWLTIHGWVTVGRHTYEIPKIHYYAGEAWKVSIGAFCSIALDVELLPGGNHRTDTVTTYPIAVRWGLPDPGGSGSFAKGDLVIGNDVWIGRGAKILGGITIGDGAVVAAYSVVTKGVDPYTIVGGAPARFIGRRCTPEIADELRRIAWWDWSDDLIRERQSELSSPDLNGFIRRYRDAKSTSTNLQ